MSRSMSRSRISTLAAPVLAVLSLLWAPSALAVGGASTTTTTLAASTTATSVGTVVTFTASVKDSASAPVTKGQVYFCYSSALACNPSNAIGSATIIKTAGATQGTAVLRTRFGAGTKTIKAYFVANATYLASSSAAQTVTVTRTVTQPAIVDTTLDYTNFPTTKFTAAVGTAGLSGQANPTGTVTFKDANDSNYVLGTATLGTTAALHFGGFQANAAPSTGGQYVDLNNDGILDNIYYGTKFVGSTPQFGLYVTLGKADGTFGTPAFYQTGQTTVRFATGDLNGDGFVDIVASYGVVLINNGSGGFTVSGDVSTNPGYSIYGIALADVNGDGILDTVTVLNDSSAFDVFVALGNGDGTFAAASGGNVGNPILGSSQTSGFNFSLVFGDFNNDGKLDIAVSGDTQFAIGFGNGTGSNTFQSVAPATYTLPSSGRVYQMATADVNNDGRPDLIVNSTVGPVVYLGAANGSFGTGTTLSMTQNSGSGFAVADVNGDGFPDVLALEANPNGTITVDKLGYYTYAPNGTSTPVDVFLNSGTGTFAAATLPKPLVATYSADVLDINGDGVPDFVGAGQTAFGEMAVFASVSAKVPGVDVDYNSSGQSIVASYAGDGTYAAAAAAGLFAVGTPVTTTTTLTTNPIPSQIGYYTNYTLVATVAPRVNGNYTFGGTVNFNNPSNASPATVCANVPVDANGVASCFASGQTQTYQRGSSSFAVTAVYSGDSAQAFSTSSSAALTISPVTQACTINWATPAAINYGTALSSTQLNASATYGSFGYTQAGTYVYNPAAGTVLNVGTQTLSVSFTPTGATPNCTAASGTTTISVVKATPTITFTGTGAHTTTDAPFTISASSTSGQTPTIVLNSGPATLSGNTLTLTQVTGTVSLTATTPATAMYNAGSQTVTFAVTAGTPTITFGTIAAHTYGDAPFAVTATANAGPAPTIAVTSGPATISNGTVTLTGAGTVVLTASTVANANFAAGSQTATIVVAKAASTITFGTIAAHTFGDAPFTITVTSPAGTTPTVTASGPATISGTTVTLTGAGTVTLTATTVATTNYNAGSQTATFTVSKATPALVASIPAAINYGTASDNVSATLTFSATTAPTGAVTFSLDGGTAVSASCTSSPITCTASLATSTLSVGNHTLTATYAGDTNYNSLTSSSVTLVVNKAAATLTTSPASVSYGAATTTLSTSLAFPAGAVPTGAVTFSVDGGSPVAATCSGTTSPLTCTYTLNTATLSTGSHNVAASFAGDSNYTAATATTATLTVSQQTPVLTASAPAIAYGTTSDTLSVSVAYTGSGNAPSGSVSFSVDGGSALVASCLGSTSPRTCTYSLPSNTLSVGSHNVSATISADSNYSAVTSATVTLVVSAQTPVLTVPAVSATYGSASTTLTATLAYTGSGAAPTGSVVFSVNGGAAVAGSCTGSSSPLTCTVNYTTGTLAGGSYAITATYAASGNYAATSGTGTLTVSAASTALALAVSQPASGGVVLTAAIAGPPVNYSSGTVTFYDGASIVCSAVALSNAGATCATPTLSTGNHSFTATYSGDVNFASSNNNSSPKIVTIDPPANTSGGSTAPGTASAPVPLTLAFGSNFTLGAINLSNSGSTTPAFTIVAGGSCSVGTAYTAGQSCTVNVVYTNPGSGLIVATVSLVDNTASQNTVGTATVTALGSR